MSAEDRVVIRQLLTGVPGLDEILGGDHVRAHFPVHQHGGRGVVARALDGEQFHRAFPAPSRRSAAFATPLRGSTCRARWSFPVSSTIIPI